MARTVLAASTPVPVDRDITVVVEQDIPNPPPLAVGGDAGRIAREMTRHMAITAQRSHVDAGISTFLTLVGRANRPWTRAELESQFRYLRIPFESVVISHERTLSTRDRARNVAQDAANFIAGGGVAGVVADEATMETPMEMDRRPMIAAIAAVVLGLAVLIGVMVWGGK